MLTFLRNLVFKDFWLKLFSFALAVLIWFTINIAVQKEGTPTIPGTPEKRVLANVPVRVVSAGENVHAFRVDPKEVEVTVQGDSQLVKNLKKQDVQVNLDLTGIEAAHDLRKRLEISTPAGVTSVSVTPEEVTVVFPPKN
jgi:YbbR domain-containing protein